MKHLVKKLSTLFIVAVLAVTMLLPTTANAATKSASEIPYAENIILSCGTGYSTTSIRYPEKIKKITSSNNDILDLKYFDGGYWSGNLFTFSYIAAKGTVVLTAKGKSGKQYITNLTINKYVNPVKKFKIGSKILHHNLKRAAMDTPKQKNSKNKKFLSKQKKVGKFLP